VLDVLGRCGRSRTVKPDSRTVGADTPDNGGQPWTAGVNSRGILCPVQVRGPRLSWLDTAGQCYGHPEDDTDSLDSERDVVMTGCSGDERGYGGQDLQHLEDTRGSGCTTTGAVGLWTHAAEHQRPRPARAQIGE
jgi:hypothetical protein